MNLEEFINTSEAAKILNCCTSNICKLCKQGKLPGAVKVGSKVWIIPKQSVLSYIPAPKGFAVIWANKRKSTDAEIIKNALEHNEAVLS